MTVLTAAQKAGVRIKGEAPASLFSSPSKFATELANLADESAVAIARAYDWRRLFKTATITGDGSDTDFALPTDYDRMPKKGEVYDVTTSQALVRLNSPDDYLRIQIESFSSMAPGFWIIDGGYMNVYPAIASAATVKYKYLRNTIIATGTKTAFTLDADTFDLPERLLTLDLVWRWQQMKGLPNWQTNEELFNLALSEEINFDKGSRLIAVGRGTFPADVTVAYPKALG